MNKMIFRIAKVVVLGVAVLAVGACSTAPMKMYSGPVLPADRTATVESGPYTDIVSVDGTAVSSLKVAVLPGKHTVEMKPRTDAGDNSTYHGPGDYYFYSRVNGKTEFTAEAGHLYQVNVNMRTAPAGNGQDDESDMGYGESRETGFVWNGYVLDRTARKRVARTEMLRLEAEPRDVSGGSYSTQW